jgi:hypothetical protein
MVLTFGVLRLPQIILFLVVYFDGVLENNQFWTIWVISLFFAPILGFCNFCWFCYKFKFHILFMSVFRRKTCDKDLDDLLLVETVVGVF